MRALIKTPYKEILWGFYRILIKGLLKFLLGVLTRAHGLVDARLLHLFVLEFTEHDDGINDYLPMPKARRRVSELRVRTLGGPGTRDHIHTYVHTLHTYIHIHTFYIYIHIVAYLHICTYTYTYTYMYMCIYIERERERERHSPGFGDQGPKSDHTSNM